MTKGSFLLALAIVAMLVAVPGAGGAGAAFQGDEVCNDDAEGDAGGGQDITLACVGALRTGINFSVTFAAAPQIGSDADGASLRISDPYLTVTVETTGEGVRARHAWVPSPGAAIPTPCGDFPAIVDGNVVTIPYLPYACYFLSGASLQVTGPAGSDDMTLPFPPVQIPDDLALPSGVDTVDHAIAWSQATFPDTGALRALLARDDNFADALASAGLQADRFAPLLLTATGALDPRTAAELQRLGVAEVTILGGESAVSPDVAQQLEAAGYDVDRVSGASRIETAVAISALTENEVSSSLGVSDLTTLLRAFASQGGDPTAAFADALALATLAPRVDVKPFLLTETDVLSTPTGQQLPVSDSEGDGVVLVGGEAAIGPAVASEVESRGYEVFRYAGTSRFGTAVALAELASSTATAILVEGTDTDAWAGGFPAAAYTGTTGGGIVLLSADDELPQETVDYLAAWGNRPTLVCGPGVSETACAAAAAALPPG